MEDSYDCTLLSELGVSLNLNLAACALKLGEHEASKDHCSIVLSFFPKNVKALFRRGLAFMKLNKFLEANSDLEVALLIEPKNKDIQRELCVVKNSLAININGKRSIEEHSKQGPTENGKVQVLGEEPPLKTLREYGSGSDCNSRVGINSSLSEGSSTQSSYTERCGMEIDPEKFVSDQQSCMTDVASSTSESSCSFEGCAISNNVMEDGPKSDSESISHGAGMKMFHFSKKGRGYSLLKIDVGTYKKLLEGKEVSFFQKSHLSTLKIRVLKPVMPDKPSMPDTDSVTSYKKKRKRRKRKKGLRVGNPSTMTDANKRDILPLSSVASNKPSDGDGDGDKLDQEVTSMLSSELVNKQALCGYSRDNSYPPPYFIFTSSKPKVAKVFHARRQTRRVKSRKEESPRRNVYIYPDVTLPVTCAILIGLFALQHFGTHRVGFLFAPIVILWLFCISSLGLYNIIRWNPQVYKALSPYYMYTFFKKTQTGGWMSLGGILLCITGSEAMFADLGHFSQLSIKIAFTCVVYPSLILAYMGQAAYLSQHHEMADGQRIGFYVSVPENLRWPVLGIAILAAVVGSQAVITGTFSIIKQCQALGCFPRVKIVHTSFKIHGQIYIPEVNWTLMILCLAVTIGFRDTKRISNASGLAVITVMLVTTCLMSLVIVLCWHKSIFLTIAFVLFFGALEALYFSASLIKFLEGAWVPIALAFAFMIIMYIWHYGETR